MADRVQIAPRHRRILEALVRKHLPGVEVWAHGSRVNGRGHDGSDLDLVLRAPDLKKLPAGQLPDFEDAIRESTISLLVATHDWACLPEPFRREIERDYVVMSDGAPRPTGHRVRSRLPHATKGTAARPPLCLDDLAIIVMGQSPSGETVSMGEGVALLNGPTEFGPYHPHPVQFTTDPRRFAQPGDLLFCVRGSTTGRMNWADRRYAIGRGVAAIRHRHNPGLQSFVRAVIEFKLPELLAHATGSTFPNVSASQLARISCPSFTQDEQSAIAYILGTLDDKIELNRQINATLEATARALFRSWFVDFAPVRAKMEGRDTGLPKEIADLFPDRLVGSDGGDTPEGWPVDNLAGHFEVMKGVSYKGSGLRGEGMPLHNLNSIHEGGGYKYEGIKFYSGEYTERHRVCPGDVIVANTEQGHDRLLIGYAAIVPGLFGTNGIASHHVYRLRPRSTSWISTRFLLFLLNSARMHDLVSGYANGTTVNMLPTDGVQRPSFVVPPRPLVEAFDLVASRSEQRREQAVRESRTLTAVREALLPKLVSGELRVRDAERLVGAIT